MKKIFLVLTLLFIGLLVVDAESISRNNIPASTYIIGKYMFTRETTNSYDGVLTIKRIMLASKSIESNNEDGMIIYYKKSNGAWIDALVGASITVPNTFKISNIDLVPQVSEKKYTISFNGNGGSGTTASVTCTVTTGSSCRVRIPNNSFYHNNWHFNGWIDSDYKYDAYPTSTYYKRLLRPGDEIELSSNLELKVNWVKELNSEWTQLGGDLIDGMFHAYQPEIVYIGDYISTNENLKTVSGNGRYKYLMYFFGWACNQENSYGNNQYKDNVFCPNGYDNSIKDGDVELEFMAIMPKGSLTEYVKTVKTEDIGKIKEKLTLASATKGGLNVTIPKFKFDYDLSLKADLKKLGIIEAFDKENADFTKMTNNPRGLFVSEALHKADIEFTEKGVKAAAVTVFIMYDKASIPLDKPEEVAIDSPFLYVIRDKANGEIWFVGTVYSPNLWENDKAEYMNK